MGRLSKELSEKSKYHLSKHRYLELVHHCYQVPDWKRRLKELGYIPARLNDSTGVRGQPRNDTERIGIERVVLTKKIELIHRVCMETDAELGGYLYIAVTEEGWNFERMLNDAGIPCCRGTFYDRRRKFFWLLDRYL